MRRTLLLILLLFLTQYTYAQKISYKHYSLKDGLTGLQVTAMLQAKDGRLWIGTKSGLSVFDGVSFKNYRVQDGLQSERVKRLAQQDDKIVVLTDISIEVIENDKINSYSLQKYLTVDSTYKLFGHFFTLKNNKVLFSIETNTVSFTYLYYTLEITSGKIEFLFSSKKMLFQQLKPNYFLITYSNEYLKNKRDSLFYFYDIKNQRPLSIYQRPKKLLRRPQQNLYFTRDIVSNTYSIDSIKGTSFIPVINEDLNNTVVFTKNSKGNLVYYDRLASKVVVINPSTKEQKQYKFLDILPLGMLEDKEGNIWIWSETGLYKIPKTPFYFLDEDNGLPNSNLWALNRLKDELFVAGYGAGMYKADRTQFPLHFKRISETDFPKNWLYTNHFYFGIRRFDVNKLVFPTERGSLVYENSRWRALENQSLDNRYQIAEGAYIDEEKKEVLTVGLNGVDIFDYKQNLKLNIPMSRFWNNSALDIERIDEDNYFVALERRQAIYNRKTDTVKPLYVFDTEHPNDTLNIGFISLDKDRYGGIWCGSYFGNAGLFLYKDGKFQKIASHVLDGIVETLAIVNNRKILLASTVNNGLLAIHLERFYQYQLAEDKSKVPNPFYWFDDSNGFQYMEEPQQNSLIDDGENRVYFTTGESKAWYFDVDTSIFDIPQLSPYIFSVEGFKGDSLTWTRKPTSYQVGDTLQFSSDERAIRFEPHCITHNAPEQIRYAYRLKHGGTWTPWITTKENKLLVTNIKAGYSQLEVKGFYKFQTPEMQSFANSFTIWVKPYWYESAIGKTAMVVLGVGVFAFVLLFTDRRRKRKEQERQLLENLRLKAERIEEIEEQLSNAQQQEEELLLLQEELNQYNEELQASAEQLRKWDQTLAEGELPVITTPLLEQYKNLPDYAQVMAIVNMAGRLTDQLAEQIQRDKVRKEELEVAKIKLVGDDGNKELNRIFSAKHPGKLKLLQSTYPELTQRETQLFILIYLGKTNAEIAESMVIEKESVKTNRKRLKKKLGLSKEVDLTLWIQEF